MSIDRKKAPSRDWGRIVILVLNGLLLCFAAWMYVRYFGPGKSPTKVMTGSSFVLLGVVNFGYLLLRRAKTLPFAGLMAAGLVLSLLGDGLIEKNFFLGGGLFAAAHLCYLAAYCLRNPFRKRELLPCGIAAAAGCGFLLFFPGLRIPGAVLVFCLFYAVMIGGMLGKALCAVWTERSLGAVVLALGSLTFWFSDLMLVLAQFGHMRQAATLCMATYFPAQWLLALALIL